jgi:hypothetical protein
MCMVIYLASATPLPESEFDPSNPGFYVTSDLGTFGDAARQHFSLPFAYYAGSHTSCGCGFAYGPWSGPQDAEEDAQGLQSVRALCAYVTAAAASGPIEIYSCWSADEGKEIATRISIGPEYFERDDFGFPEGQLATFTLPPPQ